ncbi:MAG: hypothetical protein WEC59_03885 [Salibacteraceae bacterium]
MKKTNLSLFFAGSMLMFLASCGGETENKEAKPPAEEQPVVQSADPVGFGDQGSTSYTVPSPNELFSIIKESKLPYKEGLISTETKNYSSSTDQALNFGRVTADIAYTASYERFQESMENFENLRKIGSDLGISYVFDELMVNRVKSNMDNPDSLEVISTSSYQNIIGMLEQNEKGSTLAIIAAGGFVESIYILTSLIGEYQEDSEVITKLADEKVVMENVIDYLKMFEDEQRVQEVLSELNPISDIFLNLEEVSKEVTRKAEGDRVILSGNKVVMSKDEFDALKEAATNYRNSFANASQS